VQKEFSSERQAITNFIANDALLRQFFDVFLFENLPASDHLPGDVYIKEVDSSEFICRTVR